MTIEHINPASLYDGAPFGLSQANLDPATGYIFISGQVDWNQQYEVRGKSLEDQTQGALKNLASVLNEAQSSIDQVLQLRIYIRGELGEHMEKVVPILSEFLGKARPAITGIGVASLASPETLIEIEAVAKRNN